MANQLHIIKHVIIIIIITIIIINIAWYVWIFWLHYSIMVTCCVRLHVINLLTGP
jgi:hypothetical protein